jgi:hypothetical protein
VRNCANTCPPDDTPHTCGELAACCIGLSGTYRTGCIFRDADEAYCSSYYDTYCVPRTCEQLAACCARQTSSDQTRCNDDFAAAASDNVKCSIAFEYWFTCL